MEGRYRWMDVIEEIAGREEERPPSPWDALSIVSSTLAGGGPVLEVAEVDLTTRIGVDEGSRVLDIPVVLTDNSSGRLAPQARLALIQAVARAGCALRLVDPTEDELELAGELGAALWAVLGPDRSKGTVRSLEKAAAVELQLVAMDPGGGVRRSVDAVDSEGSLAPSVGALRAVSSGSPVFVNLGYGADLGLMRTAIESGAGGVLVQASSRWSPMHTTIAGSTPLGAISKVRRAAMRAKPPAGAPPAAVVVSGGFKDGVEVAKALALGADMVMMGTAPRIALGCTLCGECGPGECPSRVLGKGTDAGTARDWRSGADSLVAYLGRVADDARAALVQMGCSRAGDASLEMLEATSYDVAAMTGAVLAGYGERLPMWLH